MQRPSPVPEPPADRRPVPLRLGALEWSLIVLHSVLWGSSFFFGAVAIREASPLVITAFPAIPAVIVVFAVCFHLGQALPRTRDFWQRMLVLGLLNNTCPLLLILWAQHQVASGVAAVFNATTPLFGVLVAHFATRDEKLSARKLTGIAVGIAGVSVLVGTDVTSGATGTVLAKVALLLAALCYALGGIFARVSSREQPFVIAAGQMLTAFLVAMPLALALEKPWAQPMPGWVTVTAIFCMGLFGSAFAALVYFTVIKRAGATNGLLVTLLLPLTPIVLGSLVLGEELKSREIAGAALIGLALLVLDGRLPRLLERSIAGGVR